MKQRLLLALLMVFASVGLIGAQNTSIDLTIPGNNAGGMVYVQISGSGISSGVYPEATGASVTVTGNTAQYAVAVEGTAKTLSFTNGDSGSPAWANEDLAMTVVGQVSSFVINGQGHLSDNLSSLEFSSNGILETLVLGALDGGVNRGWIGYVPNLKTLDCSNNKLLVLPVQNNSSGSTGATITIDDYSVSGQQPTTPIALSSTTSNHVVTVDASSLTNYFSKGLTHYSLENWTQSGNEVTYEATDGGYTLNSNDIYVGGTFTANLVVDEEDPFYAGASMQVQVTVDEPVFTASFAIADNNTSGGSVTLSQTNDLRIGDKITVTVTPSTGYEVTSITFTGLSKDANQTEINGT